MFSSTGASGAGQDPNRFFTPLALARQPSPIRALLPLLSIPGMISLAGGLPNPQLFPFAAFSCKLKNGEELTLTPEETAEALAYSATPGLPKFVQLLKSMQQKAHSPLYKDWSVSVHNGSQDALWKAFECVVSPGDSLLLEAPSYPGSLAYLKPLIGNGHLLEVPTDGDGLIPEQLERVIADAKQRGIKPPKVLYLIPTGQNPSGSTLTEARRDAVYAIACKHDLLILEDDPYANLYYGSAPAPANDADFATPVAPRSLFSRDTQQRVLRFDSFSKVMSAGLRIGYLTGPTPLVERINLVTQATSLHTSGLSQQFTYKLLSTYGDDRWAEHCKKVALFYCRKRDEFMRIATKHLMQPGSPLAEISTPSAGMFVWIKLLGVDDSNALITSRARDEKVLLIPGQQCSPNDGKSSYVRASFSVASAEQMDTALARLANLLRTHRAETAKAKL